MLPARLDEISYLTSLRSADFSANNITSMRELDQLKAIDFLTNLDLSYNPCQKIKFYKTIVVFKLPQLRSLDGLEITAKDFVKAEIFYGGDVEAKKAIFKDVLPEEEFIDRRTFTSHMLDPDSDTEPAEYDFFDKYDENGDRIEVPPSYLPQGTAYPFGTGRTEVDQMATVVNLEFITESVDYMRQQIVRYLQEKSAQELNELSRATNANTN